jgi:hypothetical protein
LIGGWLTRNTRTPGTCDSLGRRSAMILIDAALALGARLQVDRDLAGVQRPAARPAADVVAERGDVRILRHDLRDLELMARHLVEGDPLNRLRAEFEAP